MSSASWRWLMSTTSMRRTPSLLRASCSDGEKQEGASGASAGRVAVGKAAAAGPARPRTAPAARLRPGTRTTRQPSGAWCSSKGSRGANGPIAHMGGGRLLRGCETCRDRVSAIEIEEVDPARRICPPPPAAAPAHRRSSIAGRIPSAAATSCSVPGLIAGMYKGSSKHTARACAMHQANTSDSRCCTRDVGSGTRQRRWA